MTNKKIIAPLIGSAFIMMGISLPSCPGQQAMQQQLDALKASEGELNSKILALEGQIKGLKDEAEQTKTMVAQVVATVTEQSKKVEELSEKIKTPPPAAKPAKSKTTKKK